MPKIMTIEDSAFERAAIVSILKANKFNDVIEAENGEEGLKKYEKEKPNLVLLDLRMPGISGMDVLKELKKRDKNVKVIVVSIVRKQESINEALKLGASAYITKPVTKEKLIPEIKKCIG
jgi:two-component system chemotaxis response regulator CheY